MFGKLLRHVWEVLGEIFGAVAGTFLGHFLEGFAAILKGL